MKNKLTSEEQLLQSKLNEAKFSYQESDWKQIESAVAKKGFWANYSTFFKAATAFVILATAVYFINIKYDQTTELVTESSTIEQDDIANKQEPENSTMKEITTSENIPVKEIIASQVLEEEKEIPSVAPVQGKMKVTKNQSASNTPPDSPVTSESEVVVEKELTPKLDFLNINLLSKTCVNTAVEFEGEYVTSLDEELTFKWLVNDKVIEGQGAKNSYTFENAGENKLTFIITNGEEVLGKFSKNISISTVEPIDFEYENIDNPFYDNNVRLIASSEKQGEYMWYVDKYNDRVQFKKVTAWWFENPGTYKMNLDYTSENGCTSTTTKTIVMEKHFAPTIFPNAFTPLKQDGTNDVFILEALQPYTFTSFTLEILDRNGQTVFKTNDKYEGWNGRLNNNSGNILQGRFAWQVNIENNNGRKKSFQGKVKIEDF